MQLSEARRLLDLSDWALLLVLLSRICASEVVLEELVLLSIDLKCGTNLPGVYLLVKINSSTFRTLDSFVN